MVKMGMHKFKTVGLLLLATVGSPAAFGQGGGGAPAPTVNFSLVEPLTQGNEERYVGNVEAISEVSFPARVSGVIKKVSGKEGGMVEAGETLFEIEDTTYHAAVLAAKAALAKYDAELRFAEDNYARKSTLATQRAGSIADKDEATRLLELAKANVDAAKASLIDAENNFSYTKISAPISGILGKNRVKVGNYVTPASGNLNKIVQLDPIYVRISLSSRDYLRISAKDFNPAEQLAFKLYLSDGSEYKSDWTVRVVNNEIDRTSDTIDVWISFANPDHRLMPGGYVRIAMIQKAAADSLAVPVGAVMNDAKSSYVFVLDDKNQAIRRNVKVGHTAGDKIEIVAGLHNGERVITDGMHKINRPNMVVTPVANAVVEK